MGNEEMKMNMNTAKTRKRNEQYMMVQRQGPIRLFLILTLTFLIPHSSFLICNAQTFTKRIQQETPGKGTVTIHQSPAIDELLNTTVLPPDRSSTTTPAKPDKPNKPEKPNKPDKPEKPATTANTATTTNTATPEADNDDDPEADPTKKVIRGGHKIMGYRVQAFAGGNSRKDRQQAEQIGNSIRLQFPNVPVYVHFYSPRWICRVGNYRTYEEAHQMLNSLRSMGYGQASIVKGKITVAY